MNVTLEALNSLLMHSLSDEQNNNHTEGPNSSHVIMDPGAFLKPDSGEKRADSDISTSTPPSTALGMDHF